MRKKRILKSVRRGVSVCVACTMLLALNATDLLAKQIPRTTKVDAKLTASQSVNYTEGFGIDTENSTGIIYYKIECKSGSLDCYVQWYTKDGWRFIPGTTKIVTAGNKGTTKTGALNILDQLTKQRTLVRGVIKEYRNSTSEGVYTLTYTHH